MILDEVILGGCVGKSLGVGLFGSAGKGLETKTIFEPVVLITSLGR
jgi:hypothetical protein